MKCTYYGCAIVAQLICHAMAAQYYLTANNKTERDMIWELGASAGAFNCLTDIGGNNGKGKKFIKDINWNQTQPGGSLFISATWRYLVAIRLEASGGHISGSDAVLKNSSGLARNRYLRNLQFRTSITEGSITAECYPWLMIDKQQTLTLISPYLVAGIGLLRYNPQAWINEAWTDLRPLHTEGEGFKEYPDNAMYHSLTWCVPAGLGVKYDAGGLLNLRVEVVYRFTGTDYLDDVSKRYIDPSLFSKYLSPNQASKAIVLANRSGEISPGNSNNAGAIRGNPASRDAYFSLMLKAGIVLGRAAGK